MGGFRRARCTECDFSPRDPGTPPGLCSADRGRAFTREPDPAAEATSRSARMSLSLWVGLSVLTVVSIWVGLPHTGDGSEPMMIHIASRMSGKTLSHDHRPT